MATFRAFLTKWKPTAKCVVACLFKFAGGVAATADPGNDLLYRCLTTGGEQAAEHLFDGLPAEQKRAVEDRFMLLQPFLDQHAGLIRRLETLADQQTGHDHSVEALTELLRARLPADLQAEFQRCLKELGGVQTWLQKLHTDVMHRFDRLERQPKSPYWVSIDDQADVARPKALCAENRPMKPSLKERAAPGKLRGVLLLALLLRIRSIITSRIH